MGFNISYLPGELSKREEDGYIEDLGYYSYKKNELPKYVRDVLQNSHTAKSCLDLSVKYIYGNGFDIDIENFLINLSHRTTLSSFFRNVISNHVLFNSVFVLAQYSLDESNNPQISSLKLLQNENVRYCFMDDDGYISHVGYSTRWNNIRDENDYTRYFIYNPNILLDSIIDKPFNEAWDLNYLSKLNSSGVVYVLSDNTFNDIYPKSRIYPVINDCIIEHRASLYKKNGLVSGFLGKLCIVIPEGTTIGDITGYDSIFCNI